MTVGAIWGQRRFLRFLPSGKPNFLRYFSPSSGLIGVYWRETLRNLVLLCLPRLVMIFIKHSTYSAPSPGFLVTVGEHTSSHFCCSGLGHCNLVGINICCGRGVCMAKLIGSGDNMLGGGLLSAYCDSSRGKVLRLPNSSRSQSILPSK